MSKKLYLNFILWFYSKKKKSFILWLKFNLVFLTYISIIKLVPKVSFLFGPCQNELTWSFHHNLLVNEII